MSPEHFDVLIIGAGLSGVGAGVHLQRECPGKTFAILEAREAIGGTWDLFRYPGIRSDSDMYTLGYDFRPWREAKAIADGPSILSYIRETAADYGVDRHIRLQHRMVRAEWSSAEARWTVTVERGPSRERVTLTSSFLYGCTGYYSYASGYLPDFAGVDRFVQAGGRMVHPQQWDAALDYAGKRVVVIGSGATAVTLVPSMAGKAAHVTMLQRTPSYILSAPARDPIADFLRWLLPAGIAYALVRWKNVSLAALIFWLSRRRPDFMRRLLTGWVRSSLGRHFDARHFTPPYNPWDQRLCLVPDADLFRAIRDGRASVVTDHIDTFTDTGIRLKSGAELAADIVVTATGLRLEVIGGAKLVVDGREISPAATMVYRGAMLSDVPNFGFATGYTNASWTLKCDLCSRFFCRLIKHMDRRGAHVCVPRTHGAEVGPPLIDFSSGYIQRALGLLPKQGAHAPWRLHQNWAVDKMILRFGSLDDRYLEYSGPTALARTA